MAFALVGWIATFLGVLLYSSLLSENSLKVAIGDSWIFADMAKRIAQEGSLAMEVFDLVYPPLYPLLVSVAYWPSNLANSFHWVLGINLFLYSLTFFPVYWLARTYSGLNRGWALAVAWLLCLSPATLHYPTYYLAECLYIPLVAFLVWCVFSGWYRISGLRSLLFGLTLAAIPLTKSAGYSLVVAFFLFEATQREAGWWKRLALISVGVCLPLLAYKLYLSAVLPAVGLSGGYLDIPFHQNLLRPAYWMSRWSQLTIYYLYSAHVAVVFFVGAWIILRRPLFRSDRVLTFLVCALAINFILIPLFTPADPLGTYHSRYIIALAFVPWLVFFKYYNTITRREFWVVVGAAVVFCFIKFPCDLVPFGIPDGALCQFLPDFAVPLGGGKAMSIKNFAMLLPVLLSAIFIYYFRQRSATILLLVTAALFFFAHDAQVVVGPKNFCQQKLSWEAAEACRKIVGLSTATPPIPVIVDRGWRESKSWYTIAQLMLAAPRVPEYASLPQVVLREGPLLYLTHQPVPWWTPLLAGPNFYLYER